MFLILHGVADHRPCDTPSPGRLCHPNVANPRKGGSVRHDAAVADLLAILKRPDDLRRAAGGMFHLFPSDTWTPVGRGEPRVDKRKVHGVHSRLQRKSHEDVLPNRVQRLWDWRAHLDLPEPKMKGTGMVLMEVTRFLSPIYPFPAWVRSQVLQIPKSACHVVDSGV